MDALTDTMYDRLVWFGLGCLLGFLVGWTTRCLRETRSEVRKLNKKVDEVLRLERQVLNLEAALEEHHPRKKNEQGFMSSVGNIALFLVVTLTAVSAILSGIANYRFAQTQDRMSLSNQCTQYVLNETVMALNQRTTYTELQARANEDLQRAQARLVKTLIDPGRSDADTQLALQVYFEELRNFQEILNKDEQKRRDYPFPESSDFIRCLNGDPPQDVLDEKVDLTP